MERVKEKTAALSEEEEEKEEEVLAAAANDSEKMDEDSEQESKESEEDSEEEDTGEAVSADGGLQPRIVEKHPSLKCCSDFTAATFCSWAGVIFGRCLWTHVMDSGSLSPKMPSATQLSAGLRVKAGQCVRLRMLL